MAWGLAGADAEVIGKAARGGEKLGAAELLRVDEASFLQLFHVIVALVAPDLHQIALLDGLLVGDDGQRPDERSLDLFGGEGEDPPGQAEANLHGIALANALDLDARVAGGVLRCQVVGQGARPLFGEAGEIGQLPWGEGSARGEEGGFDDGFGIGICGQDNPWFSVFIKRV